MRKKDDEKEYRIRQAVIELMLKEGFYGTSIAKIAKAGQCFAGHGLHLLRK